VGLIGLLWLSRRPKNPVRAKSLNEPKKSVAYVSDCNAKNISPVREGYSTNTLKIFPIMEWHIADSVNRKFAHGDLMNLGLRMSLPNRYSSIA